MANLCVLSLYDEQSAACEFFNKIVKSDEYKDQVANQDYGSNWKSKLPWLLYKEQTPTDLLKKPLESFNLKVGFYDESGSSSTTKFPRSKYLNFKLASYTLDGQFLGFSELGA